LYPTTGFGENVFWVLGWPLPSSHGASPKRIIIKIQLNQWLNKKNKFKKKTSLVAIILF